MTTRRTVPLLLGGVLVAALTACGGAAPPPGQPDQQGAPGQAGRTLTVVASTNVWGSVVSAVAGPGVTVDSIIKDPAADPHSYESTPSDAATLSRADLIVWNGGGYDDFVQKTLDTDTSLAGKAIQAFGLRSNPGDENEHVWFDPAAVRNVVTQVAQRLSAIEPAQAQAVAQRAQAFTQRVDQEAARTAGIGQARPGTNVYSTEPIAHYLLTTAGVADTTPEEFVEAIENENDPPAATVSDVGNTLSSRGVAALVFNPQTETPVTQQLGDRARAAGVPVVDVTETLPAGQDYLQWLDATRSGLARALGAPA